MRSNLPRNVWVLGIVSLLTDVSSEMIHAVLPLFLMQLGAGVALIGLIEGIAEATASLVKVFAGGLSDYLGQRKGLAVAGYGLSALVKPLFALATDPWGVLLARGADRVGKGIRGAPRDALVADSTAPALRGAAFGLRQSLDTVGALLGPLLAFGMLAATDSSFRTIFAWAVIPGWLGVAVLIWGVREPPPTLERPQRPNWATLGRLGRDYWLLLAVALVFNLGNSSEAFFLLKAEQVGIATPQIPLLLVLMNLTYALSAYPVGVLSDRWGRLGLLGVGWGAYAVIYLGLAVASQPWQVWLAVAAYGLHLGLTQGVLLALVADRVPEALRGTAYGFLNLVVGMSLLPASLIAGALWQWGGAGWAFGFGSVCALLAVVLLIIVKPSGAGRLLSR